MFMVKMVHKNPKTRGRRAELRTFLLWGWIRIQDKIQRGSVEWVACEAHERVHWDQYKRSYGFHPVMYKFSKKYRLEAELEAYAAEYKSYGTHSSQRMTRYKLAIMNDYGLGDFTNGPDVLKELWKRVGEG